MRGGFGEALVPPLVMLGRYALKAMSTLCALFLSLCS
jgi:hypothetical protein